MDVRAHNRKAWDKNVENDNPWTRPIAPDIVQRAKGGSFELLLTPAKPVPMSWFPRLERLATLCLASGGGQQGPLLQVRYSIPHSDVQSLADPQLKHKIIEQTDAMEFGHTLTDQIGGQLQSGFFLTDFCEDRYDILENDPISDYLDTFIATRAVKP